MIRPVRKTYLRGAMLIALVAGVLIWRGLTEGDQDMTDTVARAAPSVADHQPFPDEVAAVEVAWGAPIPEDLTRIGGVDWWSWARVERVERDGQVGFQGAYRDARVFYEGAFLYRHPQGRPLPVDVFGTYVMSHLDDTALVFQQEQGDPPLDWFTLVPAQLEDVKRK